MTIKSEKTEQNYRITVVITAFNRKQFLLRAVDSVLKQSLERWKYDVLVTKNFYDDEIDNFLTKNSVKSIIFQGSGIGPRLINVLSEIETQIVCFLEDDDFFKPDKLKSILNEFINRPNLIYIKNNIIYQNPDFFRSREIFHINPKDLHYGVMLLSHKEIIEYSKLGLYFNLSSISVKRELLENYKHILAKMILSVDFALFICSIDTGMQMLFLFDYLSVYIVHSSYTLPSTNRFDSFILDRSKVSNSYLHDVQILLNDINHSSLKQLLFAYTIIWRFHTKIISKSTCRRDFFKIMIQFIVRRKFFRSNSVFLNSVLSFLCIFEPKIGRIVYYLYFKLLS